MRARGSRLLLAAVVCALFAVLLLVPSCSEAESSYRVALIGFEEGVQDEERNALVEYGQRRAEAELGVEVDFIVPGPEEDLGYLFTDGEDGYDLVISMGQASSLKMLSARPGKTQVQAVALDFETPEPVPGEDAVSLVRYRVEEGSYICGYLAGWLSGGTDHPMTNAIPVAAFIGALDDPLMDYYSVGFNKGVQAGVPDGGAFNYPIPSAQDSQMARTYAEDGIDKGADIFFCTPGPFNEDVLDVAEKRDALVILVGTDRSSESPQHVLTSLILRDDNAVFEAVRAAMDGDLDPGRHAWGIGEGTWSLAPFHGNDPYIRKELKEALREQEGKVRSIDFSS